MPIAFAVVKIVRPNVYMTIASLMTLTFIQGHKCVSNLQYLGQYLSYYIQTWHDGIRLMDAIYADARFDDLGLDARSQWVGKGKQISVACSRQLSKQ